MLEVDTSESAQPSDLLALFRAIASDDRSATNRLLESFPSLTLQPAENGATRQVAQPYFLRAVAHYIYGGDTALHVAAVGYRVDVVRDLIARGADVRARNRRGAEPLHYAAAGAPGSPRWNPTAQAEVVESLIHAGGDPNCRDASGVAPLHRAV